VFTNSELSSRAQMIPHRIRVFAVATMLSAGCLLAAGCASQLPPPKASFTQTATFDRPPKPADCVMPVLQREPLADHKRIAIVESWGALGQEEQVLAALKSSGCQTGADALVIVEDKSQVNPATAQFGLPESTQDEEAKVDSTQAKRHAKHLAPRIGELGHPGYYLDSIAIVYEKIKAERTSPGQ
jgi:hypothetical protein